MNITISQSALSKSVAIVSKAVDPRTSFPVLAGIHMVASDGKLTLEATDLTTSIRHTVPANVEEPGEAVVSGTVMAKLVKTLPDSAVRISNDGAMVVVKCERSSFRLSTLPTSDFPEFPRMDPESSVELPTTVLAELVAKTYKVVSKDDARPMLKGIQLTVDGGMLRLVATDSYRMVVCDAAVPEEAEPFTAVVPGVLFREVVTMPSMTETISLGVNANQALFEFGGTTYVTRRVEGTFPNYKQLIPNSASFQVTVDADDMKAALKRVAVMAADNPAVRIDVAEDVLLLSTMSMADGEAREEVVANSNGRTNVAVNNKYLSDCLDAVDGEIVIELDGEMKPVIVKSYGPTNYLCLLMPVRM